MKINIFNFRTISIGIVWTWLFAFALIPFLFILGTSFLSHHDSQFIVFKPTFRNYIELLQPMYAQIFVRSFYLAGMCTFFCLLLGYPCAYLIAKSQWQHKNLLLLLVIIPFWTSSLIRSYAMLAILKAKGLINVVLMYLHIIHTPVLLLYTNFAVLLGLVYNLLPFMILPLYANIEKLDDRLVDAARDLGASSFTIFRKIIIPLTLPGIMSGTILVFLPAMTLFYIPDILGGAKSILLGNLIESQFLFINNWSQGAATSIVLTVIMALLLLIYVSKNRLGLKQDLF